MIKNLICSWYIITIGSLKILKPSAISFFSDMVMSFILNIRGYNVDLSFVFPMSCLSIDQHLFELILFQNIKLALVYFVCS